MKLQKSRQPKEEALEKWAWAGAWDEASPAVEEKAFSFCCVAFVLIFMPLLHHIRLSSRPRPQAPALRKKRVFKGLEENCF